MKILREFSQSLLILLVGISLVNCSGGINCTFEGADRPARQAASALAACPTGGGGSTPACSSTQTPSLALFSMNSTGTFLPFDISSSTPPLVAICNTVAGTPGLLAVAQSINGGPAFLYVLNASGSTGTIGAFAIAGDMSASLTAVSGQPFPISTDTFTTGLTIRTDPQGLFVFVTNEVTGKIHVFQIDPANTPGALTEVTGSPFSSPNVSSIAVDFSEQFLDATDPIDGQITIFTFDSTSGSLTLAPIAPNPMPINTGSGDFPNFAHSAVTNPTGIGFEILYTANASSVSGYNLNVDGSLTPMAGSPYEDAGAENIEPVGIAIDAGLTTLYVHSANNNGILAYTVVPATGVPTVAIGSPFLASQTVGNHDITIRGETLYVEQGTGIGLGGTIDPFSINTTTAALTALTGGSTTTVATNMVTANTAP
ncbi:MAG TPA: beta-propeller fold lactonase family protein [Candidatus Sulfotelmatobacter sp.]|nr:beta-propeller fold lactonase family protein [Candidatus Sulfotelmatobacter sp.]